MLQTGPCNNQAPVQISNIEYRRTVDTLLHDIPDRPYSPLDSGWDYMVFGNEMRCRVDQKCHRVTSTVSNS